MVSKWPPPDATMAVLSVWVSSEMDLSVGLQWRISRRKVREGRGKGGLVGSGEEPKQENKLSMKKALRN